MSDWTWEYNPDAEHVVGDLPEPYRHEVEDLARRIAGAVGVRAHRPPLRQDTFGALLQPTSTTAPAAGRGFLHCFDYLAGQASSGFERFGEHVTTAKDRYAGRSR